MYLQRVHAAVNLNQQQEQQVQVSTGSTPAKSQSTISSHYATSPRIRPTKKIGPLDPLKIETDESITDIFTHNPYIPHTLLDSIEFRRTPQIALPGYIPPTRKTLTIDAFFLAATKKLSTKVQQLRSSASAVTLTIDIWSSRPMKSFLGVSAHCIVDWHLHTIMLVCKHMKGRHTADHILEYHSIISTFNLEDKIVYIVTDNAANMKCAFAVRLAQDIAEIQEKENTTGTETEEDTDKSCEAVKVKARQKKRKSYPMQKRTPLLTCLTMSHASATLTS